MRTQSSASALAPAKPHLFSCETVPHREMMALFWPLLIEQGFTYGIAVLNSSMISSAGMSVLSAVNLVDTFVAMISTAFLGLATGAAIVVAQLHGAKRYDTMKRSAACAVGAVTLFGLILSLAAAAFPSQINHLFFGSAAPQVLQIADYYLRWNSASLFLYAFYMTNISVLRGMGENRSALSISLLSSALVVLGNVIFVLGLKLSVTGLILSITIARVIACLASFVITRLAHSALGLGIRDLTAFSPAMLGRIVRFGLPICVENLLFNGGRVVLLGMISVLGTNHIASYNITYTLMSASQIYNAAISSMLFIVAGTCLGAGQVEDIKQFYRKLSHWNYLVYALIEVAVLLMRIPIIRIFHAEPSMYGEISICLAIILTAQTLVHIPGFLYTYLLRAAGDVVFTTVISAGSMLLLRVGGTWLFGIVLGFGIPGVFAAMSLDWGVRAIIFTIRYRMGKWEIMHVID